MERNYYPFNHEDLVLVKDTEAVLEITIGEGTPYERKHYCGYTEFNISDIPEDWVGNYDAPGVQLLNVHGGITYAEKHEDKAIFGFDTAHHNDDANLALKDKYHILHLAKQMRIQMEELASVYHAFLISDRNEKANMLEAIRNKADFDTPFGLGAFLKMMSGEL